MELGNLCHSIVSGKSKERKNEGAYPVYGSTSIIAMTDVPKYSKTNILIARVGANAGYVHIAEGEYDVSDNTLIVDIEEEYNLKYIFYYLENIGLNKFAKGGGQPLVTAGEMKKVIVSVPCRDEQNRIVDMLDKFNDICSDLSSGIPAEIEARQKQYEYYRDKLLTFRSKQNENDSFEIFRKFFT
ncbi:MAG: restriction endonuclease subunit S [Erysipelotrichaceae bacterium]|nr:restriction endonuclease subunit S [Erysipelotrichaceae bacterium]